MRHYKAIIIGSGAAGYAAAYRLESFGVRDIALVTERRESGTSRNTGSDKQTYYKADLSLSRDGILDMAEAIYAGGAIDGDRALVEAAGSVRCFYTLVDLGLDFPEGDFLEYIGYKTDHDDSQRATSIGPLTSKAMTEVLERAALDGGLELLDNSLAVKLIVEHNAVKGVVIWNSESCTFEVIGADYVVLAAGGSACVYKQVVYPASQHGMMSLALDAGASLSNIIEWQYGIASIGFRWNLSGSYQQVIPRYVSIDDAGVEREFLGDYIDPAKIYEYTFLKGYEWPFDSRKIAGSSEVDMAVLEELKKGRRVYMDFMHDPKGLDIDDIAVARDYLDRAGALEGARPIDRLAALNKGAIDLYKDHGIDLYEEYLEIAVCAQHCNGGVSIDDHYRTDVEGVFAIGEMSGNFGVYRPGGTALNSTQVGALRVAKYIRDNERVAEPIANEDEIIADMEAYAEAHVGNDNVTKTRMNIGRAMSEVGGIVRNVDALRELEGEIRAYLDGDILVTVPNRKRYAEIFRTYDMLKTDYVLVTSILAMAERLGSHGGALVKKNGAIIPNKNLAMEHIVVSDYESVTMRERHPLETRSYSFEKRMNKTE